MSHGGHAGSDAAAALGGGGAAGSGASASSSTPPRTRGQGLEHLFSMVLRGGEVFMHGIGAEPMPLGVHTWRARADETDRALLAHCVGPTLDVGCGPGRMAAELHRMGIHATGVDVSDAAVGMSRSRGAVALLADVFAPLPAEGRWQTVLLADGNIGIGGDPERLLSRACDLLDAGGRVVADLGPSDAEPGRHRVTIETDGVHSEPFWWAVVTPQAVPRLGCSVGFVSCQVHRAGDRSFAVLHKDS